ncbi:MAG: carboxypeptidase regulatory-like domain-containing protein [Flavobacteriales bacterium]|nr:carboxypeptidase regulatory-like domain-containing protein [Flavobacteriales bacterium]
MKQFFITISIIAALFSGAFAQNQKGTLQGTLIDDYGEPVYNAYIKVAGTQTGTISDFDGRYSFGLEPGIYTIEISHITFEQLTFENVKIEAGKITIQNATMSSGSGLLLKGAEVSVKRKLAESKEEVINMQIRADRAISIIGNEQMTQQQSTNAADAVGRVTGVSVEGGRYVSVRGLGDRYSKTTLNACEVPSLDPDRNSVQMDLFPSNMISNMQVNKSYLPELPGDFSGGLIDITTKEFPDSFFMNFSLSLGGNSQAFFNPNFITYNGSKTDFLGFDNGKREMPDMAANTEVPNIVPVPGADNSQLEALSKSFGTDNNIHTKNGGINQSYAYNIGGTFGGKKVTGSKPWGYLLGASYRRNYSFYDNGSVGRFNAVSSTELNPQYLLNDKSSSDQVITGLYGNLSYSIKKYNPIGLRKLSLTTMRNQSGEVGTRILAGMWAEDAPVNSNAIFVSNTLQYLQRTLTNTQLKGEHSFTRADQSLKPTRIDWISSATISQQNEPDLRFFAYDYTVSSTNDTMYRINKAAYNAPSRYYRKMDETNWDNKIFLTIPLADRFDKKREFKTGVSYLHKMRTFRETRFDYFETNDFDGNINAFFAPENMNIASYPSTNANQYTFIKGNPAGNKKNSYDGWQNVMAAFAQINTALSQKWVFTGGARVETTDILVRSLLESQKAGKLNNIDVLPGINLIYNFVNRIDTSTYSDRKMGNIRFGYSQTLARPTFRELVPFPSFFFTGDYVLIGNPNLRRTKIQNFDIRYELVPSRGKTFSLSGFYKMFDAPIEKTQNPTAGNTEITFSNVGNATLYGLEMEWLQNLAFVNPRLEIIEWGFNGSLIKSIVTIDSFEYTVRKEIDETASPTRPMYGQSPYIFNTYFNIRNKVNKDSSDFTANISFNIFGKRLALVSQGDLPDVYEMPRPSLDVNLFKKIGSKSQVVVSVKNILNPQVKFVHNYARTDYIYSGSTQGIRWSIGYKHTL